MIVFRIWSIIVIFQSTPPARGATYLDLRPTIAIPISIHAPREGGDRFAWMRDYVHKISIHAPREGGDCADQSVSAHRREAISIHAPREGGDDEFNVSVDYLMDFNPRPPRGGRRVPVI